MPTITSRALGDQRGTSAIEFAIVFPVFLVLTFGMIAYGIYFGAAHSAAQLAADAARASVAGLTNKERGDLARQHVTRNAAVYTLLEPQYVTTLAAAAPGDPTDFRVTVRYDAKTLPIWRLAPFLPLPSEIIERTSTIKIGGY
ncbi:MAG: TadE/TadG family type IV pilus assembly protein [Hyphomicrobium sp.]